MPTRKPKWQLKQVFCLFSAAALVVTSVPGQVTASSKNKVTEIQLTSPLSQSGSRVSATLTMKKGSSFQIKTQLTPSSSQNTPLSYQSSKKRIASVSRKGLIKAQKKGSAVITVCPKENKKIKASIKVTVVKSLKKVKKIKINQKSLNLTLEPGLNSAKLNAQITSPKKPTTKKINWISGNKKIASVSKSGLVKAQSPGTTKIIAIAADGRGAKAVCDVTVKEKNTEIAPSPSASTTGVVTSATPVPNPPSSTTTSTSTPSSSLLPSIEPSSSPSDAESLKIMVPGNRIGVKQGETLQLTATDSNTGNTRTDVTWSVNSITGISISEAGLLTISETAQASKKVTITASLSNLPTVSDTVSLTIVENQSITALADNRIQLNEVTEDTPQGLTYRTGDDGTPAFSTVIDPMRGEVTRIDESIGYKNDMIAWMIVDPVYAGKTVSISAYIKYDKMDTRDSLGLVLNERWNYSNPAVKWNASPDTWYYISGTFTLPEYTASRYDGTKNNLFLSRFSELSNDEHPVYYLDDLVFSIEKANIEKVTLSTEGNAETIYQNHTLQCSAEVTGTGSPMQKVNYSIEPAVEGVSISEDGLLTVGNAAANSQINIKAASLEDPDKFDIKTITVLPQTIDSIAIKVPENATEIYQNNTMQLSAEVTSTGDPSEAVTWSILPAVEGASISNTGLLTVGDVPGDTELHVKAVSVFDGSKAADYTLTVRANTVNSVTVKSAGDKTTISSAQLLNLYAEVDITGTPTKDVTWSMPVPVEGATFTPSGNNCTLSVADTVGNGTQITLRATSVFNSEKYDEITITVENSSSEDFDLNKLSVEYWEDFSTTSTEEALAEAGIVSYKTTIPDNGLWDAFSYSAIASTGGVHIMDDTLSTSKKRTRALNGCFGSADDYLQFVIKNTTSQEKAYTLSFMFKFTDIAIDSSSKPSSVTYELPLKMIALDENDTETTLKSNLRIPYRCNTTSTIYNKEFYEMFSTINVPAGKTVRIQLKLDGDLPMCQVPDSHTGAENEPHPVIYTIDNIAISSGTPSTISIKAGETYQLNLDTLETDTVQYYTNCYLAQYTHNDRETECTRFDTIPASVDENGLITASSPGDTALIVTIEHENGTTEHKQCIVHVEE